MELAIQGQAGPWTVKEVESLGCNNILIPGSSVIFHLVILQMTALLCWRLSQVRIHLPVSLVQGAQDQLLHIGSKVSCI